MKEIRASRKEQKKAAVAVKNQKYDNTQPRAAMKIKSEAGAGGGAASRYTEQERKTRNRHKKATANRIFNPDLTNLVGDLPGSVQELLDEIPRLVDEVRGGATQPEDRPQLLFDPAVENLTDLSLGVLDQRETPLPSNLLPQSRADLQLLCERLIIRSRREDVIQEVCSTWPHPEGPRKALDTHVSDVWRLRGHSPELYEALVTGHHGSALEHVRHNGLPEWLDEAAFADLLTRMALLWCCHDIQIILARNSKAARNPFETLVSTDLVHVEPVTAVKRFREHYALAVTLVAAYVTTQEQAEGRTEAPEPDTALYRIQRNHVTSAHPEDGDWWLPFRERLDNVIPYIREQMRSSNDPFLRELAKGGSGGPTEKGFSQLWFSGLSSLESASVPILRYLQAELQLPEVVRNAMEPAQADVSPDNPPPARLGGFGPQVVGKLLTRARVLLGVYRSAVLRDKDHKEGSLPTRKPIKAADEFLRGVGERDFGASEAPNAGAHTFYQLDILPDIRLSR